MDDVEEDPRDDSNIIQEPNLDVDQNMSMSRGEKPEVQVDFDGIANLTVLDDLGNHIKFGSVFKNKKTIVVFIRHFLCYIAKEYVEDLSLIPEALLKENDVQLVIIGCAKNKFIKPFRNITGCKHPIYCDPDRELYKKFNLLEKNDPGTSNNSRHIKSGFMMGLLSSTWRAMRAGREWQGDVKQQGGSFILGPGNIQHFAHIDQNSTDHMPINDLLKLTGVEPVNFQKDARVFTV